jgi:nitroreductase
MSETTDLFTTLATTRSIRRFRPDPVPDDLLRRVLEAATWAPSGTNRQLWRFLVLRDPAVRASVGEWYRQGFFEVFAQPPAAEAGSQRARILESARYLAEHMATEPPVLILACLERAPTDPPPTRFSGSSIYPAVQNLMLAARALGLGTCLTTIHLRREAQIKEFLGLPEPVDTYALIPLGWPASPFGPLARRPVDEVTFLDRWGARLSGSGHPSSSQETG